MNQLHRDRLAKLAQHLRTVPNENWDFGRDCRPCGCAIAQLPDVFPELVVLTEDGRKVAVELPSGQSTSYISVAHEVFGLTLEEALRLFSTTEASSDAVHSEDATQVQVADEIERFLSETQPN